MFGGAGLLWLIGGGTALATLLGGATALRFRSSMGFLVALSAGAVLGVALFDLLTEALDLGLHAFGASRIITLTAAGFAGYFVVDRLGFILGGGSSGTRGHLGPAGLTVHSLMDGLGIGIAFQASPAVGVIVAVAVLAHDMVDGINTVTLSFAGGRGRLAASLWLVADALAPLVGIGLSRLITVSSSTLSLLLAAFAGCFLYIGASELLPRSHDQRPKLSTILATLLGMAAIYAVVRAAGKL
ncbi:MAG TPA: ZIP family metal transporter [Caulobacteraceae bacterium]